MSLLEARPTHAQWLVDLGLIVAFDHDREAVVEAVEGTGLDRHVALVADHEDAILTLPARPLGVSAGIVEIQFTDEPGTRVV